MEGFRRGREGELDGTWVLTDGDTAQSHFEKALRQDKVCLGNDLNQLCADVDVPWQCHPGNHAPDECHDCASHCSDDDLFHTSLPAKKD